MERNLSQFFTKKTAKKAGLAEPYSFFKNGVDPLISSLEYDSRNVKPRSLFFALPGLHTDGSLYINDAINKGASVIVHEKEINKNDKKDNVIYLKVKNARFAMSPISAAFYDFPSKRLLVIGVTGTEGKSTTVYLIWQLLKLLNKKAGFISTVQHCFGDEIQLNIEHQTTPEAPVVQRLLREMADNDCEYVVLESSSHGLSPRTNRLGDVNFCCGVLTNLTHEHLEFHGTWEQYRYDKANLFRALDKYRIENFKIEKSKNKKQIPFGIVNADDKSAKYFIKATKKKCFTYSPAGKDGDIILEAIESTTWGNWYIVYTHALKERINFRDRLPGAFNSANVLAAILTVSNLLKHPIKDIVPLVKDLKPVKGRMTTIDKGQPFEVVIDYAHTPSSFQAIFPPLRERLDKTGGKIISLFGSAGERDTQKRSEQGQIAAVYSDIIVLTD
ncbi:MAG: UDP-N-acetylmuramyl-tripeptide synthetase [Treponema sp.]|nr:UDP-N-acetylmuramyl-tripeptide synthetase [Treponema sp.]